jgi:hypothetical protein
MAKVSLGNNGGNPRKAAIKDVVAIFREILYLSRPVFVCWGSSPVFSMPWSFEKAEAPSVISYRLKNGGYYDANG